MADAQAQLAAALRLLKRIQGTHADALTTAEMAEINGDTDQHMVDANGGEEPAGGAVQTGTNAEAVARPAEAVAREICGLNGQAGSGAGGRGAGGPNNQAVVLNGQPDGVLNERPREPTNVSPPLDGPGLFQALDQGYLAGMKQGR